MLSTDIFFAIVGAQYDQGRAASLALVLSAFALARVLGCSAACSARRASPPSPARATAACRCRCPTGWRRVVLAVVAAVAGVHARRLPVRVRRRLRADLGPRLHADAAPLRHRLRPPARQRRRRRGAGLRRHGVELALHDAQALGDRGAALRRARPADRLAAGAHDVPRPRRVRVRRLARVRDSGHGARRELHPRLQRAAVRADRHRPDHRAVLRVPEPAGRRARRQRGVPADRPLARRGLDDAARVDRDDAAPRRRCRCSSRRWSPRWSTASCAR